LSVLVAPALAAAAVDLRIPERLTLTAINVVIFVALVYPTNRWVLQPLLRVLQERQRATAGTVARASELLEDSVRRNGELGERLDAARATAQARRSAIMSAAEAEERGAISAAREAATATVGAVRDSIDAELVDARRALESEARALAQEAAVKVLGRSL
jgi:F-type H+-transporting ATPase subunit b